MRNDFERDPGVLLVKHKTAPTIPQKGSTGASARVVKTLFVCVKGLLLFPCRRFPPSGHVFVLQLRRRGVILGPGRPHRQPQKLQKSSAEFLWLHLAHTPRKKARFHETPLYVRGSHIRAGQETPLRRRFTQKVSRKTLM